MKKEVELPEIPSRLVSPYQPHLTRLQRLDSSSPEPVPNWSLSAYTHPYLIYTHQIREIIRLYYSRINSVTGLQVAFLNIPLHSFGVPARAELTSHQI